MLNDYEKCFCKSYSSMLSVEGEDVNNRDKDNTSQKPSSYLTLGVTYELLS